MYDKTFVTGCDEVTEWQLPWFLRNYLEFNDTHLYVADFGMSEDMRDFVDKIEHDVTRIKILSEAKGWFKKPRAMLDVSTKSKKTFWLDTDCQVMADISKIFDETVPYKLSMCEDRPWSKRRGELGVWYNSGVVGFQDTPNLLKAWSERCISNPIQGDQETLYAMFAGDEIAKMACIEPLPHKYNTLRLDYIDNIAVKDPLIIHHTGEKGKVVIREQMENVE
jgi:hypothetical protein